MHNNYADNAGKGLTHTPTIGMIRAIKLIGGPMHNVGFSGGLYPCLP